MKKNLMTGVVLLMAAMTVLFVAGCPDADTGGLTTNDNAKLSTLRITAPGFTRVTVTLKAPGETAALAERASVTLQSPNTTTIAGGEVPTVTGLTNSSVSVVTQDRNAKVEYATGSSATPGTFRTNFPSSLVDGYFLFVKVTSGSQVLYYVIQITVEYGTPSDGGDFGKGEGFGVTDPAWVAKYPYLVFPNLEEDEILTEAKLPDPSYWNNQATEPGLTGHIHTYPDPFHFANGNRVTSLADWENRRKEMQLLVSYYGKGNIPSIDPDVVDIWLSGQNNTTINLRYRGTTRTQNFTISVTNNTALTVAGNEGKLYASSSGANTANMSLVIGSHASSVSASNIRTLYGLANANNLTRDSATAWCAGVLLAAIEGTDDPTTANGPRQGTKQYFYPTPSGESSWFTSQGPLYSTGYSTDGKRAFSHVMGIGRNGARFGFADVGDAGAGGPCVERFVAVTGFRLDITLGEALGYSGYSNADVVALGLDPTLKNPIQASDGRAYGWPVPVAPIRHQGASTRTAPGSLGGFEDLWGAPYYTYGLSNATNRPWMAGVDNAVNISRTGTGNLRMVRGWSPYWEDFDRVSNVNTDIPGTNSGTWAVANVKIPYAPYQHTTTESWAGVQNWMQARGEDGTSRNWFGDIWRQFNDLHDGLDLDKTVASGQSNRGKEGFGCTMPFDTYFWGMLNAPYGTNFIRSGIQQTRTNQPSEWAQWMFVDEIYKFFGEQEYAEEFNNGTLVDDPAYPGSGLKMGWDKYIWRNGCFFNWGSHGGNTSEETSTVTNYMRIIRSGNATTETVIAGGADAVTLAKVRDAEFPIDDPVYYLAEWHKVDWGRPGAPTIAERVRRRVEPIMKDYFMGEQYHAAPAPSSAADAAAHYHDAAKAAYTPTGPKFKRMDWRGLIDNPELEL